MARLIQKTGFISRKSAGGYMKYIATREGVEGLNGKGPATEKQKEMVAKLGAVKIYAQIYLQAPAE